MAEQLRSLVQRVRHWAIFDHIHRVRWVLVGFVVLILIAIPWGLRAEERGLEAATRQALGEAGLSAESIEFSGRSGTVTANLTRTELRRANVVVAEVSGVRGAEFVLLDTVPSPASPVTTIPPSTTLTTFGEAPSIVPPAPFREARLEMVLEDARLRFDGTLPTAQLLSELTRLGNYFFGPTFANTMLVDDRVANEAAIDAAPELVPLLPVIARGTITLDSQGVAVDVVVETDEMAQFLSEELETILGPDVPIRGTIAISAGSLPGLDVQLANQTVAEVSGTVNNEAIRATIASVLQDFEGAEKVDEIRVDARTVQTYETIRAHRLLVSLAAGAEASLVVDEPATEGLMTGGETWLPGETRITSPVWGLIPKLAAIVAGDPTLHLDVTVGSAVLESGEPNLVLSRDRAERLELHLMRAGIEPNRMTVGIAEEPGSSLWFLISPADDEE